MSREKPTRKQFIWLAFYLGEAGFNATQAARLAHYKWPECAGHRNLHHPALQRAITRWWASKGMTADEVLGRLADQARGDIGVFFKVVEVWVPSPLPSQEVLEERREVDDEGRERNLCKVKRVVLDLDKLMDPEYSHLVHKFTDSPKDGLGIELHNAQTALQLLGKHLRLFVESVEHTGKDGGPIEVVDARSALAAKLTAQAERSGAPGGAPESEPGASGGAAV